MRGTDYAQLVGESLRRIRLRRGMSLQDVQAASGGRWKAAVVGAYERGDRNVTVARLFELTEFYGVSVAEVLPDTPAPEAPPPEAGPRTLLNLGNLERVPAAERDPLKRLISAVQARRGTHGEAVVNLRADDLNVLALLYQVEGDELLRRFEAWGLV